jgi:hypothetical protein
MGVLPVRVRCRTASGDRGARGLAATVAGLMTNASRKRHHPATSRRSFLPHGILVIMDPEHAQHATHQQHVHTGGGEKFDRENSR